MIRAIQGETDMKTAVLRGTRDVLDQITVGIADSDTQPVAIERLDKHAYRSRIGEIPFLFRSTRPRGVARPREPGIELRHTDRSADTAPVDIEEVPERPGVIQSLRFAQPVHLHIERIDEDEYWCGISDHQFSMKRIGSGSVGIELVRA